MTDCLAATGTTGADWLVPVVVGIIALLCGVGFVIVARKRSVKGGAALTLALLFLVTTAALSAGGAAPAQAATTGCDEQPVAAAPTAEPTPTSTPTPTPGPRFVGDSAVCTLMNTLVAGSESRADQFAELLAGLVPIAPADVQDEIALLSANDTSDTQNAAATATLQTYVDATCTDTADPNVTDYGTIGVFEVHYNTASPFSLTIDAFEGSCVYAANDYSNKTEASPATIRMTFRVSNTGLCAINSSWITYFVFGGTDSSTRIQHQVKIDASNGDLTYNCDEPDIDTGICYAPEDAIKVVLTDDREGGTS